MRQVYTGDSLSFIQERCAFLLIDDTDNVSGVTGKTPVVKIRYPGGGSTFTTVSVSELGNGWYEPASLSASAQVAGTMLVHIDAAAGYHPVDMEVSVLPTLSTTNLDVAVSTRSSHAAPDLSLLDVAVSTRAAPADLSGLSTYDPTADTVDVGKVAGVIVAGVADFKADVSNIDVAVSTRSSHGAPDLSLLDVAISTRSSHTAPDLSNLDVAISTRSSHAAPDLSNLDAAVSTRSVFDPSTTAVDVDRVAGSLVAGVADFWADLTGVALTTDFIGISTFDSVTETVNVGNVAGTPVSGPDDFKAAPTDLSGLSTFDPLAETVDIGKVAGVAITGVDDFKADITALTNISADLLFLVKTMRNRKELALVGVTWHLIVYDDDDVTPIMDKAIKDKSGSDINDILAGALAIEVKSTV